MKRQCVQFVFLILTACGETNTSNMETRDQSISSFFAAYEQRFNDVLRGQDPDIKGVTGSFADCFVESSPVGVIYGKNDASFEEAILKGFKAYKEMGIKSMNITSTDI